MLVLYFYLFIFWRIAHFESTSNPVAPSSNPVTLGSLPKFWCLYFLIYKMEIIKVTYLIGLMCIVNELIDVKYLEQRLVKDDIFYRWGHLDLITCSASHSCWVVQIMKTVRLISELVLRTRPLCYSEYPVPGYLLFLWQWKSQLTLPSNILESFCYFIPWEKITQVHCGSNLSFWYRWKHWSREVFNDTIACLRCLWEYDVVIVQRTRALKANWNWIQIPALWFDPRPGLAFIWPSVSSYWK